MATEHDKTSSEIQQRVLGKLRLNMGVEVRSVVYLKSADAFVLTYRVGIIEKGDTFGQGAEGVMQISAEVYKLMSEVALQRLVRKKVQEELHDSWTAQNAG